MHASTRRAFVLALGLGLSVPALAQHGRPPLFYEVVSISAKEFTIFPGGDAAEARDINNLGEIVGWGTTSTGNTHAFKRALLGSTIDLGAGHPWKTPSPKGSTTTRKSWATARPSAGTRAGSIGRPTTVSRT